MLDSLTALAIGVAGALLYLRIWNWVLSRAGCQDLDLPLGDLGHGDQPTGEESATPRARTPPPAIRQRRRMVQAFFLLGLAPYLLLLFHLMDRVRSLIGGSTSPVP